MMEAIALGLFFSGHLHNSAMADIVNQPSSSEMNPSSIGACVSARLCVPSTPY